MTCGRPRPHSARCLRDHGAELPVCRPQGHTLPGKPLSKSDWRAFIFNTLDVSTLLNREPKVIEISIIHQHTRSQDRKTPSEQIAFNGETAQKCPIAGSAVASSNCGLTEMCIVPINNTGRPSKPFKHQKNICCQSQMGLLVRDYRARPRVVLMNCASLCPVAEGQDAAFHQASFLAPGKPLWWRPRVSGSAAVKV